MPACPNGHRRHPSATGPCDCTACHHDRRAVALAARGDLDSATYHFGAARQHEGAERRRNEEAEEAYRKWWKW